MSDPDSRPHLISILPLFIGSYAMQATQQFLFDSRETLNFYLIISNYFVLYFLFVFSMCIRNTNEYLLFVLCYVIAVPISEIPPLHRFSLTVSVLCGLYWLRCYCYPVCCSLSYVNTAGFWMVYASKNKIMIRNGIKMEHNK